ncbi:MAG: response regulator [Methylococcaceae bacterium]|nr:response regulator [Methylococcaceae bacterium]MDP3902389.1 response regulator [Methylococcaceae bacterium]
MIIIDDDEEILSALTALVEMEGYACETYVSALSYLQMLNYNRPCFPGPCCVLCDVKMPELGGLELQSRLAELDDTPVLLMSGACGVQEAVSAFHAGALDFLIKPIDADTLLIAMDKALVVSAERYSQRVRKVTLAAQIATLTERERDIARRVAAGQTNPAIAEELGIALRTVKLHRQRAMEKIGAVKMTDLVRIADEGNL